MRKRLLGVAGFALLLGAVPHVVPTVYVYMATDVLIFALFATSLNLIMGYGGMVSFGHAAYFGVSAYTAAILLTKGGFSAASTFLVGPLVALIAGLVFGFFCVRLTSVYFSMLTLAFAQVVYTIVFQWYELTMGDTGITGIFPPDSIADPARFYYFTLVVVAICMAVLYLVTNSPFGYVIQAIRENARRTRLVGLNVKLYQLLAFGISALFSGIAGVLFVYERGGAYPEYVSVGNSIKPLVMVLLGGMHNFLGPMVGSVVYTLLETFITKYTDYWQWVLAIVIIVCIIAFPEGILGVPHRRKRKPTPPEESRQQEAPAA